VARSSREKEREENAATLAFHDKSPLEGYRQSTFMILDRAPALSDQHRLRASIE
jgi:hypothetical protein